MSDDINIISLIEKDIFSFSEVSRFPGVGFTGNIQNMLGAHQNPGIRVTEEDAGLVVNCEIIVYFGVNIPQLCYDIQTKVKGDIERMTGMPVKAVNIRVEGIDKASGRS
ncbi:MAG: Asp23/Gls24 family envelope stress response protein [Mogibacterium sp.]|nr:Asp23/Gls24 family envelope stress response protein [Mogibacterium sp.]